MPEETPQKKSGIIRTFESDISDIIKSKKTSLTDIATAEQRKREELGKNKEIQNEEKSTDFFKKLLEKKTLLIIGSVIALVVAITLILFAVFGSKDTINPTTFTNYQEMIFSNVTKEANLTGVGKKDFVSEILNERRTNDSQLGSITNILLLKYDVGATRTLTSSEFFDLLEVRLPSTLSRYIESDFMFGLHSVRNVEPFLILKTSSFENAFTGMLDWEKDMERNLESIFIQSLNPDTTNTGEVPEKIDLSKTIQGTSTTTTTTTSEEFVNVKKVFSDMVVKNKDARVIKDKKGEPILMYAFADRKTIVITTNQYTMTEIFDRLNRVKFSE
ncbi:MAG: hypothetical protein WC849_03010 [Candidatus Paceibacterota bacterium]